MAQVASAKSDADFKISAVAPMRIAMIGTRGVPARYGGFETAVEEVGSRLVSAGHSVTVYCRGEDRSRSHLGMSRIRLPALNHPAMETLSHTALSVGHLLARRSDVALVFNAANAPLVPILRAARIPVAVHVDGLEWKRAKWGPAGRRYYLANERLAARSANRLIADAVGIQDYYREKYGAEAELLAYGAPIIEPDLSLLGKLNLSPGRYHLVVARLEPENHVDLIIEGYLQTELRYPLIVVGSVPYASDHEKRVKELASRSPQVRMLGGIWDQDLLNSLYGGAATYIHGHHVGGTNPSLLRAMGAAAPVVAFDVNFNREVLGETGQFFTSPGGLARQLLLAEHMPDSYRNRGRDGQLRAGSRYRWADVASGYEALCASLLQKPAISANTIKVADLTVITDGATDQVSPVTPNPQLDPALPRSIIFDAFWWTTGPESNRQVMRSLVTSWLATYPHDNVTLAIRAGDETSIRSELGAALDLIALRSPTHGIAIALELPLKLKLSGQRTPIFAHNFTPVSGQSVVFIHDVLFQSNPEWFTRSENFYFRWMPRLARRAVSVCTSSSSEVARIQRYNPKLREVSSVGLTVHSDIMKADSVQPSGISDPNAKFILTTSRLNKRKNLVRLIDAAAIAIRDRRDHSLVIAGQFEGDSLEKLEKLSSYKELRQADQIKLLGFVRTEELRWLYENTRLFVFPSLDEGFGLPPLEARYFGASVVASDIPVMRENLGAGARYFDPSDTSGIAVAMRAGLKDGRATPTQPSLDWPTIAGRVRSLLPEVKS